MGLESIGLVIILALIVIFLIVFFNLVPLSLWISAVASGVHVSIGTLVGMRFRRINPSRIDVWPLIKADQGRASRCNMNEMEAHLLAGGNVDRVINALIAARVRADPAGVPEAAAPSTWPGATCFRPCR